MNAHRHTNTCITVICIFKTLDLAFKISTAAFPPFFFSDPFEIPNFFIYLLEYFSLTETFNIASELGLFSGFTPKNKTRPLSRPDYISFMT